MPKSLSYICQSLAFVINSYDRIIEISAFPRIQSIKSELKKAAILRILLGCIVMVRFAEIAHTLIILDLDSSRIIVSIILLLCILAFTIGFLTPVFSVALLCSLILSDRFFSTTTLGTSILVITILPLFLINAGQYYSLDQLILNKKTKLSRILNFFYSLTAVNNKEDIVRAYFLSFILYAVMSFGALLLHVQDTYWISGLTVKSLLINSYLCKYYTWFIYLDKNFTILFSFLSISAGVSQSIFQFFMIPLILFNNLNPINNWKI